MNIWHDINPKRITVDEFVAVVEIPKNSKVKYCLLYTSDAADEILGV